MASSSTAYDDAFRTVANNCRKLIIPVVNGVFGKHYSGLEKIAFSPNEVFFPEKDGVKKKRITDSCFDILTPDGTFKRYHIECESRAESSILLRNYDYDSQIALRSVQTRDYHLCVTFPNTAVFVLRHTKNTPDSAVNCFDTPQGKISYKIPIVKTQLHSLEKIFKENLLFFLPFYIFRHEKKFKTYEKCPSKLEELKNEYLHIREKLDDLQEKGELDIFTKETLRAMILHVVGLLAKKYKKVKEGVRQSMRGKLIDYPAKRIYDAGRMAAFEEIKEERDKEREQMRKDREEMRKDRENTAKDMLRDKMEISLVKKYTKLPLPRIRELAREVGVL